MAHPLDAPSADELTVGVLLLRDGTVAYANPAARAHLGPVSAGKNPAIEQFGALGARLAGMCRRVEADERPLVEREVEGPSGLLDISLSPRAGNTILVEIVPLEWHVSALAERQAEQQRAALRAMLRGLAHELKNPLGGLRGAAQLLARRVDDSDLEEYCEVIVAEADRLSGLIERFASDASGRSPERINIHAALERVYQLYASREGLRLERDYDPSIPEVMADRDALIQAILNLVTNAVEAGAEHVVLRTRIRRLGPETGSEPAPWIAIEIEDDGPGVPEEIAELVFYPLVSGKDQGGGLGLSIAQSVASRHHGRLEFHSRPGRTVFSLYLPLARSHDTDLDGEEC